MPRRGAQQRDFPEQDQRSLPVHRIGIRVVRAPDRTGVLRDTLLDPAEFRCTVLAGELADEWVDYIDASKVGGGMAQVYRRAVREFCTTVDAHLVHTASAASLARAQPDVAAVLAAWERALPTSAARGQPAAKGLGPGVSGGVRAGRMIDLTLSLVAARVQAAILEVL
jgi:hypothetical protein